MNNQLPEYVPWKDSFKAITKDLPAKTIPHYEEWKKTQTIEINVQVDTEDNRVLDTTFYSLEELESYWRKLERSIEVQLREDYDDMVEYALMKEEDEAGDDAQNLYDEQVRDNEENR